MAINKNMIITGVAVNRAGSRKSNGIEVIKRSLIVGGSDSNKQKLLHTPIEVKMGIF